MQFPQQVIAELIISYDSSQGGGPAVVIGPGAEILMFNTSDQNVGGWTPLQFYVINPATGAEIAIYPVDFISNEFPTIYFKSSGTSQVAFINCAPDSSGNPQLGINSTPYTDPGGGGIVYERLFMSDDSLQLAIVRQSDQAEYYGFFISHSGLFLSGNTPIMFPGNNTVNVPLHYGDWNNLTLLNGWGATGSPEWYPQAVALPDGTAILRGNLVAGTIAVNTIIANIPALDALGNSLRPAGPQQGYGGRLIINASSDPSKANPTQLFITPDGNIALAQASVAGQHISLDGIQYNVLIV